MDLGIHFPNFTHPGGDEAIASVLAATAQAAEDGGFTRFTVMDHFFQMDRLWPADSPMLEGYTALGFLAGRTQRIQLGALVTGVTYRHPGILAKTVTTLDVLSGGRAWLGIGAAWYEREHRGLGVPYPSLKERFERLEETIQITLQMWSDDDGPYEGKHYRLAETLNRPRPIGRSRIPILIGGGGEQKTLRLVAKYADASNLNVASAEELRHKLGVLRTHADREGRDFSQIQITVTETRANPLDVDAFLRTADAYAAIGVHHIVLVATQPDPVGTVTEIGEKVLPRVAELGK